MPRTIIRRLALKPHPEGGHYRETFRDAPADGARGAMTAIYYLLAAGEESAWHKVDATEIWHYYAGARLSLSIAEDGRDARVVTMGGDVAAGQPAAGDRAGERLAVRAQPRRLDPARLHGRPGLQLHRARAGAQGLAARGAAALSAALSGDGTSARSRNRCAAWRLKRATTEWRSPHGPRGIYRLQAWRTVDLAA